MLKRFWIPHPAADREPVGPLRWVKWHLSQWLFGVATRMERDALDPNWRDDDYPF